MRFTSRQIETLKPRDSRYEVFDSHSKGFGIRVSPSGNKSWISRYRRNNRLVKMTLGKYPALSLADARIEHQKIRTKLHLGKDPHSELKVTKLNNLEAPTLNQLIDLYLENYAKPNKRSWKDDKRRLENYIGSEYGSVKAKEITRKHISVFLDGLVARGLTTGANRVYAATRGMFNWAIRKGILETSPCAQVSMPAQEHSRDRVLNEEEILTFWNKLPSTDMPDAFKLALQIMLVTAQRKVEVLTIEKEDLDLKNHFWTIPRNKAKNGMSHRVPLSSMAESLIKQAVSMSDGSRWLFPALSDHQRPIPANSINQKLLRNRDIIEIKDFVPHDLRRTAASFMASLGTPRLVIKKILNHVEKDVTAVYDRHGYDNEKRKALEQWSKKLDSIINEKAESNIITIYP